MALERVLEAGDRRYLQLVNPGNGKEIFNPIDVITGEKILVDNRQWIEELLWRLKQAQNFWSQLAIKERARFFKALKREVVSHSDAIAQLISEENGKNIAECWEEILVVLQLLEYYRRHGFEDAKEFRGTALNIFKRIKTTVLPSDRGKIAGVVGVITPWNYPFMIPFNVAIRSLFYGNAVL